MPSALKPGIYYEELPDAQVTGPRTEEAHAMAHFLARNEGLFVGIGGSGGGGQPERG